MMDNAKTQLEKLYESYNKLKSNNKMDPLHNAIDLLKSIICE